VKRNIAEGQGEQRSRKSLKHKRVPSRLSCRDELTLLQRAVRWWSYTYGLALERRSHLGFEVKLPAKSAARERRLEAGKEEKILAALGARVRNSRYR